MPVTAFDVQRTASVVEGRPEVYTEPKPVDVFTGMTVEELRNRCRGLRVSGIGKKVELQARLRAQTKKEEIFATPTLEDVDRMNVEELQSFLRGYLVSATGPYDVLRARLKTRIRWRDGFTEKWDSEGHALPEMKVIPSEDKNVEYAESPKKLRRTTAAGGYCSQYDKRGVQLLSQKRVMVEEKYDSIRVDEKTDSGMMKWQSTHMCSFKNDDEVWPSMAMIVNRHEGGFFYGEVWMPSGSIGVFRHELKINNYGLDDFQYTVSPDRALVIVVTAKELRTMYAVGNDGRTLMKTVYQKAKIEMIFLAVQNVGNHLFMEIFGGDYQKKIRENPISVFSSMHTSSVHLMYGTMRPVKALVDLLKPNRLSGGVSFEIRKIEMISTNPDGGDENGDLNKSDENGRLDAMPSLSHETPVTAPVTAPDIDPEMPLPMWPVEGGDHEGWPAEWDEGMDSDMKALFDDL